MITLEPNWDEINSLPTPLTEGERCFIKRIEQLFEKNDARNLEIFVQANINGDRPDIIVVEQGAGIWIIEVKDWNLQAHYKVENEKWYVENRNKQHLIKSPFAQAERYKKNIFSLHSHYLATRKLTNRSLYGMVRCGVYFHVANEAVAKKFKNLEYGTRNASQFMYVFGQDATDETIEDFFGIPRTRIQDAEYNHLMRFIRASEEARPIRNVSYNSKQRLLIKSEPKRQKIKGVAGAGKSFVLAARAVDALKRTNGKILIVTFNITLMNYLHDRISEVRGVYRRRDFDINSYHAFINAECNNYGISTESRGDFNSLDSHYQNENLFEYCKESIDKYDAIFIDEVQDFQYEWQQILVKYFLKENGELVLFGDEKQNIYNRELENKKIRTVIPGAWNNLSQSHRLAEKTTQLAEKFQKHFFTNRYEIDVLESQLELDLTDHYEEEIHYFYTQNVKSVLPQVEDFILHQQIHPNDIVFLGSNKKLMRNIDFILRKKGERTTTMLTSLEEYDELEHNHPQDSHRLNHEIERARKVGFWMNSGCVKVSTIQSFKGWEANTVILIISEKHEGQETIDELIYTGLTRCKKKLIILNEGNVSMHKFFNQEHELFDSFNDNTSISG